MWNSPKLFDALWNSIYVGVVSSLMATMLLSAAKAFTKYKFPAKLCHMVILILIPEIMKLLIGYMGICWTTSRTYTHNYWSCSFTFA